MTTPLLRVRWAVPVGHQLRVRWEEGRADPWLILTDLAPDSCDPCWYGLRMWIERGFKLTKRGGWQWQATRMTVTDRAARLWLVVAVATLWLVSVGGEAEADASESVFDPLATALPVQTRQRRATRLRLVAVFRAGLIPLGPGDDRPRAPALRPVLSRTLAHRPAAASCPDSSRGRLFMKYLPLKAGSLPHPALVAQIFPRIRHLDRRILPPTPCSTSHHRTLPDSPDLGVVIRCASPTKMSTP